MEAIASASTVFTHTPAQTPDVRHVFHKACMDAWCANRLPSEACICPTCRQAVGEGGRFKAGCKCCGLPFSSDNPRFVWTTLDHTSPVFNNTPYHRSCISPLIVLDSKSLAVTYVGSETFQRLLGSLADPEAEEDGVDDAILQMGALELVSQRHPDWVEYMLEQDGDVGTAFVSLLLMSLSKCS
jgi:hypothetical protein